MQPREITFKEKEETAATRPIAARSVHKVFKGGKKRKIRIRDAIRFPTTFSKRYTGPRITVEPAARCINSIIRKCERYLCSRDPKHGIPNVRTSALADSVVLPAATIVY